MADAIAGLIVTAGAVRDGIELVVAGDGLDPLASWLVPQVRRVYTVGVSADPTAKGRQPLRLAGVAVASLPFGEGEIGAVILDGTALGELAPERVGAELARVVSDRGLLILAEDGLANGRVVDNDVGAWGPDWVDLGLGTRSATIKIRVLRRAARSPAIPTPLLEPQPEGTGTIPEPTDPILALARHLPDRIVIVDVGCRGGFNPRWVQLGPHVHLVGFDPDRAECERVRLGIANRARATLVPLALGDRNGRETFYVPREPAGGSLLPPDLQGTAHLGLCEGALPEHVLEVEVARLDDWMETAPIERVDAMKLDIEGGELLALFGSVRTLAKAVAVEVEVRFNRNNIGAPFYGEVDAFLRQNGFALWRIRDAAHYRLGDAAEDLLATATEWAYFQRREGEVDARTMDTPPGQMIWANAHWVRVDAIRSVPLPWHERVRFAIVARALEMHDLAVVNLRRALLADAPSEVASSIIGALEAAGAQR